MLLSYAFYDRATLLELTKRSSMKPDISRIRLNLLTQNAESIFLALPHRLHLLIEKTIYGNAGEI